MIKGTYYLTQSNNEITEVRALIMKRRLQILVHSCIYYKFNNNLISDRQWDSWAKELVVLQKENLLISSRIDYHKYFIDFDGTTGFNLPYNYPEIINKAQQLIALSRRYNNGPTNDMGITSTRKTNGRCKKPSNKRTRTGKISKR